MPAARPAAPRSLTVSEPCRPRMIGPISVSAAADRLGVSRWTIRRAIDRGDLRAFKVAGRAIRVEAADVDALAVPVPAAPLRGLV